MGHRVALQNLVDFGFRDHDWAKTRPVWPAVGPILAHAGVFHGSATFFAGFALLSVHEH